MDQNLLETLANLRILIGYLGEKAQLGWWQSNFFSSASNAFLSPVFPRTQLLAQYSGVTRSTALVHDQRIGVGNVYHLFRLPEDMEQGVHRLIQGEDAYTKILSQIRDQNSALGYLREHANMLPSPGLGPVRIGNIHDLRMIDYWQTARAHYLAAFEAGHQAFPYFMDIA